MHQTMTGLNDKATLSDYEDEDIFDVVLKLEKSFGLKFERDAFISVQTFDDLCDVFANKLQGAACSDCTSQQAFYKIRNAIAVTQRIDSRLIGLDTKLEQLFPRHNRHKKVNLLQDELHVTFNILTVAPWMDRTIGIGIAASLIMFFFKWQFALTGLLVFIGVGRLAYKFFTREFKLFTVRQLTTQLAAENYAAMRRRKGTFNRQEISAMIIDTFSNDLDIDRACLTSNDKFSCVT